MNNWEKSWKEAAISSFDKIASICNDNDKCICNFALKNIDHISQNDKLRSLFGGIFKILSDKYTTNRS